MKENFLKLIKTIEFLFIGIAVLAGALLGVISSDYAIFIFIGYVAINIFGLATKRYKKSKK